MSAAGDAPPGPTATGQEITTEPTAPRPSSGITEEPLDERDLGRFADEDDGDYPGYRDDGRRRDPDAPLSNDYAIDLNRWFAYGSAHYTAILGPAAGFTAIYIGISIALGFVGTFLQMAVDVPLFNFGPTLANHVLIEPLFSAGLAYVCLRQLGGRPWTFADFFAGLRGRYFGSVILNSVLLSLLYVPALGFYAGAAFAFAEEAVQIGLGLLAAMVLAFLAVIYFAVRLSFFSLPLILDRDVSVLNALKGSWALSADHFWGLFGMWLLLLVIGFAGVLACYVGALFSLPFAALVHMAGYLLVAGIDPPLRKPVPTQLWRENG
jgi:hypothetical protein